MSWIQTHTGRAINLIDPDPRDISLDDIAHSLARLCRYTGHVRTHYSVAQHCVLASMHVPLDLALPALFHDAGEAYTGDISAPMKWAIRDIAALNGATQNPIKVIERVIDIAIATHFGFEFSTLHDPAIKNVDLRLLVTERRDLLGNERDEYVDSRGRKMVWDERSYYPDPFVGEIEPWSAAEAESQFRDTAARLLARAR